MTRRASNVPKSVKSFGDYFDTSADVATILRELGYTAATASLSPPRFEGDLSFLVELERSLLASIPFITLTSEAARREFLVAPLLREIAVRFRVMVNVEYALDVSPTLRGKIDYLLDSGTGDLVIIEAKLGDMYGGQKQLAAELVAMDQWMVSESPLRYGAVTVGDVWRFAVLDRVAKTVTQDVSLFKIPGDLEDLTRVIVGVLRGADGQRE
ncbi:MAG: hypothetical protein H8F28_14370 [Fibrella sp.]|nr:hypothetical protein [Armatimonadota bacterium]